MLELVALNQERFRTPGLRTDSRGVAIGEQGILRFSTLNQVVGFFRAFTDEQSLDYLITSLRIFKARSQIQGLEILIDFSSQGSHMLDRAAAIARLLRGEVFTGRTPHFVRYRDNQAPFGYDIQRIVANNHGITLYTGTGPLQFSEEGEISFRGLILSLSLNRNNAHNDLGSLFVRVPGGLRNVVQRFLWQRDINASITELHRKASGRFDQGESFYLFKTKDFPTRLIPLFEGLPGVELYHTRHSNIFVQRGYEHPFALESCRKVFEEDNMLFFSGTRDTVDLVEGEPLFVDTSHLKGVDLQDPLLSPQREALLLQRGGQLPSTWTSALIKEVIHYPVHLIHRHDANANISAVFINNPEELRWLKRLVYLMPESALEDYQMALTDQGCLILNRAGIELIPIGLQLCEVFNNVFIPINMCFSPPVGYDQLKRHLNLAPNKLYLMPAGLQQAFSLDKAALMPIARFLLADVDIVATSSKTPAPLPMQDAVEMVNRDIGYFALWGHNLRNIKLEATDSNPPLPALPPADLDSGT